MSTIKFEILTGMQAYLLWHIYNDCQPKIETIMAIEQNLELIISTNGDVLAYRYDHPREIIPLVRDDGCWRFTDESQLLNPTDQQRLKLLCREFCRN
jgi:hypothetical protein